MQQKLKQLLIYHDLILSIVKALEERDLYTADHSLRVADMSEYICNLIDLSKDETTMIHIAAHLHDIGKIGIEDSILLKQGKLTSIEWDSMKKHSEKGFTILNTIESFKDISYIVRSHHERWDGKGYPDGLVGYNIPFGARIIAIADSIDAMMSDRPYRKGMGSDKCKSQIQTNAGIMYDETIVSKVVENWDEVIKKMN